MIVAKLTGWTRGGKEIKLPSDSLPPQWIKAAIPEPLSAQIGRMKDPVNFKSGCFVAEYRLESYRTHTRYKEGSHETERVIVGNYVFAQTDEVHL